MKRTTKARTKRAQRTDEPIEIEGEELLEGEVKRCGNTGHVIVPKRWRGADLKVVPVDEPDDED